MNLIQKKILDNKLVAFEFKWACWASCLFLFSIVYLLCGGPGGAFLFILGVGAMFSFLVVKWITNFIRDAKGIDYDRD